MVTRVRQRTSPDDVDTAQQDAPDGRDGQKVSACDRPEPVVVAASATNRADATRNQDAHTLVVDPAGETTGVVVADGIGSWESSGVASHLAADTAAAELAVDPRAVAKAFAVAQRAVVDLAVDDPDLMAGTTLLTVTVDDEGSFHCAHVGNGGLIIVVPVPGALSTENDVPSVRWLNLLLPDSEIDRGRDLLSHAFTTRTTDPIPPVEVTVRPRGPAVLMAVSDGIWTEEQGPIGRTNEGREWRETPAVLRTIIDVAAAALDPERRMTGSQINMDLHRTLNGLRDDGRLEDDATVGMVVLR